MLTPSKAFEIASQWGSLIRAGDPGAVFYTFPLNDARPLSEAHRAECLAYLDDLLSEETGGDAETRERAAELAALQTFFRESPIGDGVSKPEAPNEFRLSTEGANGAWSDLDAFTQGYIEALFFTEEERLGEEFAAEPHNVEPMGTGSRYRADFADLAPVTLAAIMADCAAFQAKRIGEIHPWDGVCQVFNETRHAEAGRDFWYTRNGHGCGFWDGDWPEPYASKLDAAANAFGEVDAYLGDDGRVYLSGGYVPKIDPATGYDRRDASEEARAAHVAAAIAALRS